MSVSLHGSKIMFISIVFDCLLLQVAALNLNYSDSGLFGIYTVCDGSAAGKVQNVTFK